MVDKLVIDIRYGTRHSALSNLTPRVFEFRGWRCHSMEGLLQAFKFRFVDEQQESVLLCGHAARLYGRPEPWYDTQVLWWDSKPIGRHTDEYQELLNEAYACLFENEDAADTLLATGDAVLQHTTGTSDPNRTILTTREYISRLNENRDLLKARRFITF